MLHAQAIATKLFSDAEVEQSKTDNWSDSLSQPQDTKRQRPLSNIPRRSYHVQLGFYEKALLGVDPALKKFKSYKNSVKVASKVGNILTDDVITSCSYQIMVRAMTKKWWGKTNLICLLYQRNKCISKFLRFSFPFTFLDQFPTLSHWSRALHGLKQW
jgi:hypothetical protein